MKIRAVEAIPIAYPEPNDADGIRHVCVVRVLTDEGVVGWGEAVTIWPEATRATVEVIHGLSDVVVGRDPERVQEAWDAIVDHTWWYGGGGIATFAHAALDIALWDLCGQIRSTSVVDLLGGSQHDHLPAVVSCHAARADIGAMVEEMAGWVGAVQAWGIKVGFGKRGAADLGRDQRRDADFVEQLRRALGPAPRVMVDIAARIHWTAATAEQRIRAFEEHDLHWIEEPLGADDPEGYAALRERVSCLIAYGEREWTVRGVDRILTTGTVDVVGVDPGRTEGITGFKRACDLAGAAGRQANAHAWAGPIVYQAALSVSHASSACRQFEVQPLRNPLHQHLAQATAPVGGRLPCPSGPGLGITVDEAALRRLRLDAPSTA